MALTLKTLYLGYNWLFEEVADKRPTEQNFFLMSSVFQPLSVLAAYFYFIYRLGPDLMKNRKPFDLRNVLLVYNFLQIIANSYIVFEAGYEIWYNMNWSCEPIDYSNSPSVLHLLKIYHFFLFTRMADLLETIFFVLRKKQKQVTFLHVYHHAGMFTMMWGAVKFLGGGYGTWVGLINGAVHVVMYIYYFLSAWDEKWKKNVTFKKSITQMQLVQFTTLIIIYTRQLLIDCDYPRFASYFFVPQNFFMLVLFGDFYRKTYFKKTVKPSKLD